MSGQKKLVDPKCLELAEHFFADEPPDPSNTEGERELAQAIQQCVEDWFEGWRKP